MLGRLCTLTLMLAILTGCASYRRALESTATYIEHTQSQGCLCIQAVGGGGFGATINGSFRGFASYGGIDPEVCLAGCGSAGALVAP